MKLLLIDAYALIYRSYYGFIKNPRINSKGMNTSAIFGFVNSLEDVLRRIEPTHVAVGFDPSGLTFRHEVYPEYKAQREETPEAIRYAVPIIRDIINAYNIPILEVPRYEADDVIGTISKQAADAGFEVFMMTPDKDYGQLVGEHIFQYRPKFAGDYETLGVPEVLAKYGLKNVSQVIDLLGLMGDASDNIPGCPGVGEKTAVKLLAEFDSVENLLNNTDKLKGALKTKVEENADKIKFSKFLATIAVDAPITFDADSCVLKPKDEKRLINIYTELEFKNLIAKLGDNSTTSNSNSTAISASIKTKSSPKKSDELQLSLFDDNDEQSSADTQSRNVQDVPQSQTAADESISFGSLFDLAESENKTVSDISTTKHTYYLVDTDEKRNELGRLLSEQKSFVFDTETTGTDTIVDRLVGMSFAVKEFEAWYVPIPDDMNEAKHVLAPFVEPLQNQAILKIGQNIKFDIMIVRKYGICVAGMLFDTMIAHYLLNPELHHGMDYLAETYLHYKPVAIEELIGAKGKNQRSMRDVEISKICEYAAEDADVTLRLKNYFEPLLKENDLDNLFYDIEMPLIFVLAEMELTGVKIDTDALKNYSARLTETQIALEKEIHELAGMKFNVNSTRQVGEVLFDVLKIGDNKIKKTKTGGYSTDEATLEKLRDKHVIVGKLLDYRGIKKLLSTYTDALPKLINSVTGKIHTSFNQTVTSTGRLSSTSPNLQNIPVREEMGREIRKAFIADNADCVFFSADYSQVELRIMAHLSGDRNMIEAFRVGADIHASTAAKIYEVPDGEVTKEMRRKAKTANFGIIYGISVFGLAERLSIPRAEAKELIDGYFKTYPQIQQYMKDCIDRAREKGYVETIFHRRRYLPDIMSHNAVVRGYAERNAINAPVQGSAADIIKIAMIRIYQRFKTAGLKSKMILQVHDELNFNVYRDELEQVRSIVIEEMENAARLDVPLIADCGVGDNWLEAH